MSTSPASAMVTVDFVLFPVHRSMLSFPLLFSMRGERNHLLGFPKQSLQCTAMILFQLHRCKQVFDVCYCCAELGGEEVQIEKEKSWRLQERESFNEKVSWLQSHHHMTLMTDWCRTCCGKVWKELPLYREKKYSNFFIYCLFGITDWQNVHKNLPL